MHEATKWWILIYGICRHENQNENIEKRNFRKKKKIIETPTDQVVKAENFLNNQNEIHLIPPHPSQVFHQA